MVCLTCNFGDYDKIDGKRFNVRTIIIIDESNYLTQKIENPLVEFRVWNIVGIHGNQLRSRYVKSVMLCRLALELNEPVLYHDFNIEVKRDFFLKRGISLKVHPFSSSLNNEFFQCGLSGKLRIRDLQYFKKYMLSNTVYECNVIGLYEPNIEIQAFMTKWFKNFMFGIKRDQLHFSYLEKSFQVNDLPFVELRTANDLVRYESHDENLSFKRKLRRRFWKVISRLV